MRVPHIGPFISIRGFSRKRHLLAQRSMAGHTEDRLLGAVLGEINDLAPRARPHRPAVEALLPVRVLLGVTAPAGFGT